MTTYRPQPNASHSRHVFTADEGGHIVSRTLDDLLGLDAPPVQVNADGTVSDDAANAYRSPELHGTDAEIKSDAAAQGWDLLEGYTGQYAYRGPVMHPSESIGGRMAEDILSTPGVYVAVAVDGAFGLPVDAAEDLPVGWAVARWVGKPGEVLADLPDDEHDDCAACEAGETSKHNPEVLPMTCGTCGHRYADNTPAGRCPREVDHEADEPSQYRVRYNFTGAANGYHFTEWYDTLDEAREYVEIAARFGELVILGIEGADGEAVL